MLLLASFALQTNSSIGAITAYGASGRTDHQIAVRTWLSDIYRTRQRVLLCRLDWTLLGLWSSEMLSVEHLRWMSRPQLPLTTQQLQPSLLTSAPRQSCLSNSHERISLSCGSQAVTPGMPLASDSTEKLLCRLRGLLKPSLLACFHNLADSHFAWLTPAQGNQGENQSSSAGDATAGQGSAHHNSS